MCEPAFWPSYQRFCSPNLQYLTNTPPRLGIWANQEILILFRLLPWLWNGGPFVPSSWTSPAALCGPLDTWLFSLTPTLSLSSGTSWRPIVLAGTPLFHHPSSCQTPPLTGLFSSSSLRHFCLILFLHLCLGYRVLHPVVASRL